MTIASLLRLFMSARFTFFHIEKYHSFITIYLLGNYFLRQSLEASMHEQLLTSFHIIVSANITLP